MISFSSQLVNAWLGTSPLQTLLNSCTLYIFAGNVPANADAAVDGTAVLLATVKNGGAGGTFQAPANGVLQKTSAENWSGSIGASGTATFYRLCIGSDAGTAASGAGNYRVQGSIGTDASFDLQVANAALTSGGSFPVSTYELVMQQ